MRIHRKRFYKNAGELWAKKTTLGQINEALRMHVFSTTDRQYTTIPFATNFFRDWTRNRQYTKPGSHGIYDYDEGAELEHRREWAEKTFRLTFDLVKDYISREDRILDIGCGSGWQMNQLYERGYTNIVGIDADSRQVEYARSKRPTLGNHFGFLRPDRKRHPM